MLSRSDSTIHAQKARGFSHKTAPTRSYVSVSTLLYLALIGGCDQGTPAAQTQSSQAIPEQNAAPTTTAQASPDSPWTAPENWTFDPEPKPMRLATYGAPAGETLVEIAISRFSGDVGGELANVNRWRNQVGLGAIDEASLDTVVTRFGENAAPGYSVLAAGERMHLFAAGVYDPATDQTWFVRAMDTPEAIDAVISDLQAFARSISRSIAGD